MPNIQNDWESAVCGLFDGTYPLYPQEPLLLLIKTEIFKLAESLSYNNSSCALKLELFVLLASKADFKGLLECWSKYG